MATIKIGAAHGGTGLDSLGTSGQILGVNSTEDSIAWLNPSTQATYAYAPDRGGFPLAENEIGYVEFTPSPSLLTLLTTAPSPEQEQAAIICTFPILLEKTGTPDAQVELVIGTNFVTPDFTEPYKSFYSANPTVPGTISFSVPVIGGPLAFIWHEVNEMDPPRTLRIWVKNIAADTTINTVGIGLTTPVIVYYNGFS